MSLTTLDPKTALVLIDLQNGFTGWDLAPHPSSEVVARARELAEAFRTHGLPVVLMNNSYSADYADMVPGRVAAVVPAGALPPPDWDQITDSLGPQPTDLRITKRNWGAFHGTGLDTALRRRGVTQVVLGGIATSFGVDTTAREAHAHGYHVTLATDAMSDMTAAGHENCLERIFPWLGESGTTAEIIELLAKTR